MKFLKRYENFKSTKATLDEVFSECNVFIEDLKKCEKGSFLIRGVTNTDIDIEMFERDYNRAPRDLSYDLHKKFNFFFFPP